MHVIIANRRMRSDPVIPQRDRPLLPLHSDLEVLSKRDVFKQQLEQRLALLVLEPHDAFREARVHKQRFLSRGGMDPHDRVLGPDRVPTDEEPIAFRPLSLREPGVFGA